MALLNHKNGHLATTDDLMLIIATIPYTMMKLIKALYIIFQRKSSHDYEAIMAKNTTQLLESTIANVKLSSSPTMKASDFL